MKNIITLLIFFILGNLSTIAQQKNIWHYIENEQVISENKEDAHASFTSYSSIDELKNNTPTFKKSLNGIWQFKWVRNPADRPTKFMNPTLPLIGWDSIKVPSKDA